MAFLPAIPQPGDQLSVSQANILNNFGILGAIAGNGNPSSGSINATSGFNWIYLPNQGANPPSGSAFPAFEIGMYSFLNPRTNQYELYINKTNASGVVRVPSTASVLGVTAAPALASSGWTYLPSGLLLKWGTKASPIGATPSTVTFAAGATIPAFTGIISVIISGNDSAATPFNNVVSTKNITTTTFQIVTTGAFPAGYSVNYLAIGY